MKTKDFLKQLDDDRIVAAIAQAELKSSGEIRVFVSEKAIADPLAEARTHFVKLGMTQTKARNGVLIYFAPRSQAYAILGDEGIHQVGGDALWTDISRHMADELRKGHPTEALIAAIGQIGHVLAKHFPRSPDDRNELPNQIERD